jgi:hypothetical protein
LHPTCPHHGISHNTISMHAFDAQTSRLPHVIFSETQYLHINKL